MSTHFPSKTIPRPIWWRGFARNTLPVMGTFGKKLFEATNHCIAFRKKVVFSKCMDIQNIDTRGSGGAHTLFHGRFHAGHGTKKLVARVGLAPMGTTGTAGTVYLTVGGTDTNKLSQGPTGGSDVANNFNYGRIFYTLPTDDTTYEWSLVANDYARPFSLTLYTFGEQPVDTANGGTVDPGVGMGSPILSAQHADLAQAHWDMWKRNSCHLFTWTRPTESDISENATSYTNLFDGTSTGGAAVTVPSVYLQTTRHNRVNHDVPIVFSWYGDTTQADVGSVRLVDSSNTTLAELTGLSTTNQWNTTTATLTAGLTLCTVEVKASSGSIRSGGVSIFEYLA